MAEGEERVRGWGGFAAADHVDVGGEAVGWVEEAHYSGYHAAPVAALGCCGVGGGSALGLVWGWEWGRRIVGDGNDGPYSVYPSFCINLWHTSAYCGSAKPFFFVPDEKA